LEVSPSFASRILPIIGDLSKPLFGLAQTEYNELASRVDCVIHNAAYINWILPYKYLRKPNVLGTYNILELLSKAPKKIPLHYISSIGVVPLDSEQTIYETSNVGDHGSKRINAYCHSKWVAEEIVKKATSKGLWGYIYRPATLFSNQNGVCNTSDFSTKMIQSCIELGVCPDDGEKPLQWVWVDYASDVVVTILKNASSHPSGTIYHITDPRNITISDLYRALSVTLSTELQPKKLLEWLNIITNKPNKLQALHQNMKTLLTNAMSSCKYDCTNTQKALGDRFHFPHLNEVAFKRIIQFLHSTKS